MLKTLSPNPKLIIEVLSPSTEAHDRGLKFAEYRTIAKLRLVDIYGNLSVA
jgi:Uma2 family endonuclease